MAFSWDHGADPNAADDYDETVLARAASSGHLEVVRKLLRAGARPSTPGELGKPPHELAQEEGHPEVAAELFRSGAETGSI
ncbi:MAG TPA: ankyrin repeat domain-containing protein [Polyangiaceae bacterium]